MRYEVAALTTLTAASVPFATLVAGASSRMKISEIGIFMATAVASDIALARSATATTTPTKILGQAVDNGGDPAAIGSLAVAWATIGTANSISLRRISLPATVGAGVIWTWPDSHRLILQNPAATSELMFVNRGGGVCATFTIYVCWEE